MHIPDGFLNSHMAAGMSAVAAGILGYAARKVHQAVTELGLAPAFAAASDNIKSFNGKARKVLSSVGREYLLKLAGVASLIFAAQMFNFSISSGTSGHMLGGLLAALLLGPWGGALAMGIVLVIQSLFYADGGIFALGVNIVNMAGIGSIAVYYLYMFLNRMRLPRTLSIAISSWASVVLAALACSLEVGLSGTYNLGATTLAMFKVHAIIGIGEAVITLLLLMAVQKIMNWPEYSNEK